MSNIQVTSIAGQQINVSTGTVVGPLPQLQIAAGNGITIQSGGGVSTISANIAELSISSSLADLTDVGNGSTAGQVLAYNGTSWGGLTLSIPSNLADLSDVDGTPTAGQVLAWNGSQWAPADDQTGGSSDVANLADLSDVSATSPSSGQALTWDGSQWAAANVPVGTTVNGLSGSVNLVSGDNVAITLDGQNLTIASVGGGSGVSAVNGLSGSLTLAAGDGVAIAASGGTIAISAAPLVEGDIDQIGKFARNLRITRNSLGELNLEWDSPFGYVGEYVVELTEVGLDTVVTSTSAASVSGDGSLAANISLGGAVEIKSAILFASNGSLEVSDLTAFFPTVGDLAIDGSNATITNAYLPGEFLSPGAVHLMVVAYDATGSPVGRSEVVTRNVQQHGSPVAPEIAGVAGGDGTIELSLFSQQTPHQRGFYDFTQITYFAEINTAENATAGWIRGSGVIAEESDTAEDFTIASAPANFGTEYFARVVAANPLGEGEARAT